MKAAATLMINVLNGTLDMGIGEIQEIRGQLDAGQVRLLGVLSDKRLDQFPDPATAKEQGVDMSVTKFRGLAGRRDCRRTSRRRGRRRWRKFLASEAYKAEYEKEGLIPVLKNRAEAGPFTVQFAKENADALREFGVIK